METFGKGDGRGTAVEATRRSPSLRRSALLSSSIHPSVRRRGGVCLSNIEAPSPLVRPDILGSSESLGHVTYVRCLRRLYVPELISAAEACSHARVNPRYAGMSCRLSRDTAPPACSLPPSLASDIYLSLACSRIRISVPHGGTHSEQMRETGRHIKAGIICYPT